MFSFIHSFIITLYFRRIIEKALEPKESTWTTLFNCVLLVHTILLFGSETAVDKILNINRFIKPLQTYNSALVKGRGTDYGAPVREEAKVLLKLLTSDSTIRSARQNSRKEAGVLVPLGNPYRVVDSVRFNVSYLCHRRRVEGVDYA